MRAHTWTALVAIAALTGCGSSGRSSATAPTSTRPNPPATDASFCHRWRVAIASGKGEPARAALRDPPPEIAAAAAVVRTADAKATNHATDAAVRQITDWVTVHCDTGSGRHVAPPVGADLAGFELCSAGSFPAPVDDALGQSYASVYGEADHADPYRGPMIAVFSTKTGQGGFVGDGDRTPVTVHGLPADAAPITVFQQSIVPELGTVIAWKENGRDVGLYGRLWGKDRIPELVALANHVREVDGKFDLPSGALPGGFRPVFRGAPDASWSLVGSALFADYTLIYQRGGETVYVSGAQSTPEQYAGSRFFALPLARERIGDHTGWFGSAWSNAKGPWVATWRDADGFTVRVTGLGAPRADVLTVARQSRDLGRAEWAALVSSTKQCDDPVPRVPGG